MLFEPRSASLVLQFIALQLRWVHATAKGGGAGWLPLPDTPCKAYARIPEQLLEDAFDYLQLLARCVGSAVCMFRVDTCLPLLLA